MVVIKKNSEEKRLPIKMSIQCNVSGFSMDFMHMRLHGGQKLTYKILMNTMKLCNHDMVVSVELYISSSQCITVTRCYCK